MFHWKTFRTRTHGLCCFILLYKHQINLYYFWFMILLAESLYSFHQIDDFWNEAIKLADLHHPNVVAFYGVVLDGPGGSVATVTEYMVNGSLRNALQKNERYDTHFGLIWFFFLCILLSLGKYSCL